MGKRVAICLSLMVVLYFLVCLAAAQADVLRVSPEESTVLDKNTLEKWTLEEFERDNVKLLVGHEIEVNLVLHREVSDIPDSYYLELRTDLHNPDWNYEENHYKGSPVTVWNSSFEHAKSAAKIILTAKVPDSLIISDIKEPYFEEHLTGISEKEHYFELVVYNKGDHVETVRRLEFFATNSKLMDMTKEIKEGLEGALNASVDYPESELIYNLLEGGHPGWAYSLYKNLNVPSNQQLLDMKKAIEENIEEAHKKGLNYHSLETRIENLFKNGNPEEAKDLSAEYKDIPPEPDPSSPGLYAILFIVGLAIGAVSSIFIFKIGEKERTKRLQKLEKLPKRISQTAEKIRNMETKEADTSKKREFKNVREDLEEVESEIKKGLR